MIPLSCGLRREKVQLLDLLDPCIYAVFPSRVVLRAQGILWCVFYPAPYNPFTIPQELLHRCRRY